MTNKQFVKYERQFTYDLLKKLNLEQWNAKTLCAGWTVEDLAAHLVTRERSLIGGIGLVVASLQKLHDKRIERVKLHGHDYILRKLNKYPWYMPASVNTAEFWVHNEDFLRGELRMSRPKPSNQDNSILWKSLKSMSKIRKNLLSDIGNVDFVNSQTKEVIKLRFNKRNKVVTITGTAGELLLYFYGRRKVAKVNMR